MASPLYLADILQNVDSSSKVTDMEDGQNKLHITPMTSTVLHAFATSFTGRLLVGGTLAYTM